ncbi:MAG: InlB B-repeat-containing protein [Clostridia bacterium]|nr:InlB B-repeat-containing protein [Clostridia bacterium]
MKKLWLWILTLLTALCLVACGETPEDGDEGGGEKSYTVSITQNIAEAGSTMGAGTYTEDTSVTLTATTNVGYTFLGWYDGEELVSSSSEYVFVLSKDVSWEAKWELNEYTISVQGKVLDDNGSVEQAGTVAISGTGIYTHGESVTVTATTNVGYTFLGWYNGSTKISVEETYGLTATEDVTFTATWEKNSYAVSVNQNLAEAGETTGAGTYLHGAEVVLAATTNEGYVFLGWYDANGLISADNPYEFTATSALSVTAKWETVLLEYTVAIEKNILHAGTVEGAGEYAEGETISLTATTKTGYTFLGWYDGETLVTADASCSFVVEEDRTLTAKWEAIPYQVSVSSNMLEAGGVAGAGTYDYGTGATLRAIPNEGYTFLGWYDGEELISSKSEYIFVVTGDVSWTAKWKINEYAISVQGQVTSGSGSVEKAGTVAISGTGKYTYGESVTITATTNEGYKFLGWYEGETKVSSTETYVFTATSNRQLVAKWSNNQTGGDDGWTGIV